MLAFSLDNPGKSDFGFEYKAGRFSILDYGSSKLE
jgi:hypothetical protein